MIRQCIIAQCISEQKWSCRRGEAFGGDRLLDACCFLLGKSRKAVFEMKPLEHWSFATLVFPCLAVLRCHSTSRIPTYILYTLIKPQDCKIPLIYTMGKAVAMNSTNGLFSATKGVRVQDEIGHNLLLSFLSYSHKLNYSITVSIHSMVIGHLG